MSSIQVTSRTQNIDLTPAALNVEVVAVSRTQVIEVNPTTGAVSVINAGPQGPAGIAPSETLEADVEALSDSLELHLVDPTPHAVYDDAHSFTLIFENHLI